MRSLVLALAVVAVPSVAVAGPMEVGAGLGLSQSSTDQQDGVDSSHTLGLYGRIGLGGPIALQLEASKLDLPGSSTTIGNSTVRTASADVVFELGQHKLVPLVLVGVGFDRATQFSADTDFTHKEVGVGLEYRLSGGFVLGFDARTGTRDLQSAPDYARPTGIAVARFASSGELQAGGYRSARLTIGVRF